MHANIKSRNNAKQYKGDSFQASDNMLLVEVPPPPEELPEEAVFWWNYYCGLMVEAKILSRLFIGSVKNFVFLSAAIEKTELLIKEQGIFTLVPKKFNGADYVEEELNPLFSSLQKMFDQHDRLANSLGLTPYSSKVNAIDATGKMAPSAAPKPPDVGFDRPTIPMTSETA